MSNKLFFSRVLFCISILASTLAHAMQNEDDLLGEQLLVAAREGKLENVKLLITAGAQVNHADKYGWTALMFAACSGDRFCVTQLDAPDGLLYRTNNIDNFNCVKELINARAQVNQANNDGCTALMCAATKHDFNCVKELIAAGAQTDRATKDGKTALICAATHGDLNCVKALIAAKAPINHADEPYGRTALMRAASYYYPPVCEFLVDTMLRMPNRAQKARMVTLLGIDKCRKKLCRFNSDINACNSLPWFRLDANARAALEAPWLAMVYKENRDNFESSIAYQEIAKLEDGPLKQDLLGKYNRNPNANSTDKSGKK